MILQLIIAIRDEKVFFSRLGGHRISITISPLAKRRPQRKQIYHTGIVNSIISSISYNEFQSLFLRSSTSLQHLIRRSISVIQI